MDKITEYKATKTAISYDLWAMKQALKKKDLMRQAARNDKKQRVMLAADFE